MSQPAPSAPAARSAPGSPGAPAAPADAATRFLVELENVWTLLRLYGTDHPAFCRAAESAAAAVERPARVSINPRGFSPTSPGHAAETLRVFAQKLRAMGLVGLTAEPGLTAAQAVSLVQVLNEADRTRGNADAVVEKIAAATGGRVRAVPLRLDALRLVEGTAASAGAAGGDGVNPDVWREMFASAFTAGPGDPAPAELARAFEAALRGQSSGDWDAMVGAWTRQLASLDPARLRGAANARSGSGNATTGDTADGARAAPLDAVAGFLGTLSPVLCQRLLKEAIAAPAATGPAVSEPVVLALADRLPAGVVLGALAAVDRTNGAPSTAALALLRKMSASVGGAGPRAAGAAPATAAELAEVASALEHLLGTRDENQFVPEEYLHRRQELSRTALAADGARAMAYPDDDETARHAAGLAFGILSAPDAAAGDVAAALAFVSERVGTWVRAGQFALAREAVALAGALTGHADPAVSKPAAALVSASANADDLLAGAARRADRAAAVEELADLLRQSDGPTLATLLSAVKPAAGDPLLEALRRVLPDLPDKSLAGLFRSIGGAPPPSLLAVLTSLPEAEALKAVAAIAPHASGPVRRAAVHAVFRRDFRWPPALIDQCLRDDEPEVRRLAVMKLVGDADLAAAAGVLAAASRPGKYEPDVALGLSELLRRHRHHPDVRPAWRQWTWSKRWWVALLFVNVGTRGRAA